MQTQKLTARNKNLALDDAPTDSNYIRLLTADELNSVAGAQLLGSAMPGAGIVSPAAK
jgi:hypothetical protein